MKLVTGLMVLRWGGWLSWKSSKQTSVGNFVSSPYSTVSTKGFRVPTLRPPEMTDFVFCKMNEGRDI